jgi:hypothetical protein
MAQGWGESHPASPADDSRLPSGPGALGRLLLISCLNPRLRCGSHQGPSGGQGSSRWPWLAPPLRDRVHLAVVGRVRVWICGGIDATRSAVMWMLPALGSRFLTPPDMLRLGKIGAVLPPGSLGWYPMANLAAGTVNRLSQQTRRRRGTITRGVIG